jgi:large subunit ribosomal protein L29
MKITDLKTKTDDQLEAELAQLKKEQFNLRFQSATQQIQSPARVKQVRRTIARIKTLQVERLAAAVK